MATSRNQEVNMYGMPNLTYERSGHHYQKNHKTTFNTGQFVPIYANELIQPGDTIKMALSMVVRMNTPFQPVMDNAYHDTYAFAISWLDLWKYTKEFWGENTQGAWSQTTEYIVPRIQIPNGGKIHNHTLLSYIGFPQKTFANGGNYGGGLTVNAAVLTYNEWFRDQNYMPPYQMNYEGTTITYDADDFTKGGYVPQVCKLHDRFTSGLPEPQKGDALAMPVGTTAPVIGTGQSIGLRSKNSSGQVISGLWTSGGPYGEVGHYPISIYGGINNIPAGDIPTGGNGAALTQGRSIGLIDDPAKTGMIADLSQAIGATLNAQRTVVAAQHILEGMAIYGTRYREIIKGMWGVNTSDTAQHIPEYLGGKRTPINIEQVTNVSGELGETGATSITADYYDVFTKSFTEHSVILVIACIRTDQTYGQGIPRQYFKERRLDYYWNELAHISFQPVYRGELFATGNENEDKAAFSFLPAFQEYRSEVNQLSGMFNPEYTDAQGNNTWLKEWTYANKFENAPIMDEEFIKETTVNMDRTLTVQSTAADQFIADYEFYIDKYSEVPAFGNPGLKKF